jgi:hypothetical protein
MLSLKIIILKVAGRGWGRWAKSEERKSIVGGLQALKTSHLQASSFKFTPSTPVPRSPQPYYRFQ